MEEKLYLTTTEEIQNLIYTIRGKPVMIDSDVARLYHYETKFINLAVKRNKERFPEDFCFQLTESELEILNTKTNNNWLQIATSSIKEEITQSATSSLQDKNNKHRGKKCFGINKIENEEFIELVKNIK